MIHVYALEDSDFGSLASRIQTLIRMDLKRGLHFVSLQHGYAQGLYNALLLVGDA